MVSNRPDLFWSRVTDRDNTALGCEGVVTMLLEKEVDINAVSKVGKTAIEYANERGRGEVAKLILKAKETATWLRN